MAGRKPTPTAIKLIRGNPGHRPLPTNEPKPETGIPTQPAHLSADARAEWERVVPVLDACGVLTLADAAVLAAYCQAYGRWAQAERGIAKMAERDELTSGLMIKTLKGNAVQNPLVGTANKSANDMVRFAAELGMTPAARSRIHVEKKIAETNPFIALQRA